MGSLTAELARELWSYDSETGELRWRVRAAQNVKIGSIAGTHISNKRYWAVRVKRKPYAAQKVIWLIVTGEWPDGIIDHIDNNGLNNAWNNLREATSAQNCGNRRREKIHQTGFKGVSRVSKRRTFRAKFRGKEIGHFYTPEEAHAAYAAAANAYFGEYSRLE
jgi:hypothetical protein